GLGRGVGWGGEARRRKTNAGKDAWRTVVGEAEAQDLLGGIALRPEQNELNPAVILEQGHLAAEDILDRGGGKSGEIDAGGLIEASACDREVADAGRYRRVCGRRKREAQRRQSKGKRQTIPHSHLPGS